MDKPKNDQDCELEEIKKAEPDEIPELTIDQPQTQPSPQQINVQTINTRLKKIQNIFENTQGELNHSKKILEDKKFEYELAKDNVLRLSQKFITVLEEYHTQRFTIVQNGNSALIGQRNTLQNKLNSLSHNDQN